MKILAFDDIGAKIYLKSDKNIVKKMLVTGKMMQRVSQIMIIKEGA